jgi:hypothetical protein
MVVMHSSTEPKLNRTENIYPQEGDTVIHVMTIISLKDLLRATGDGFRS